MNKLIERLISNQLPGRARLSRQTNFNSGTEVQIPYILILASALRNSYDQRLSFHIQQPTYQEITACVPACEQEIAGYHSEGGWHLP